MELPAKRIERLLQPGFSDEQFSRQTEEAEMIRALGDCLNLAALRAKVRAGGLRPAVSA
jgi:hypothetical protein